VSRKNTDDVTEVESLITKSNTTRIDSFERYIVDYLEGKTKRYNSLQLMLNSTKAVIVRR